MSQESYMANKEQVVPWEFISLPLGCCWFFFPSCDIYFSFLTYIWLESCRSEISGEENNRLVCDTVLFDMEKYWDIFFSCQLSVTENFQLSTDYIYTNMHKWFLKIGVWDLSKQDFLSFRYFKILLNKEHHCVQTDFIF